MYHVYCWFFQLLVGLTKVAICLVKTVHTAVATMVSHLLMAPMEKAAVCRCRSNVALMTSPLLVVPTFMAADVTTPNLVVVQITRRQREDPITKDVGVSTLPMVAVQTVSHHRLDPTSKAVPVTLINLVVVLMGLLLRKDRMDKVTFLQLKIFKKSF